MKMPNDKKKLLENSLRNITRTRNTISEFTNFDEVNIFGNIKKLFDGNLRYRTGEMNKKVFAHEQRKKLISGQKPIATIISCSDSRIVPEYIFDQEPGEIFVIRIAGNIATPEVIASVEYAVSELQTRVVMVMGHQNCGAVHAATETIDRGLNMEKLLSEIKITVEQAKAEEDQSENNVCKIHATFAAKKLIKQSPLLNTSLNKNNICILSSYYHLDTGEVELLDYIKEEDSPEEESHKPSP